MVRTLAALISGVGSRAMTTDLIRSEPLEAALDALADTGLTTADRAGLYAVLYTIQLRINRKLRAVKDEIILYMERANLKALGPLTVKATAIDVRWPCNDPGNWADATMQDEMAQMAKVAPEFFRHVPEHLELDTFKLGEAVSMGDPVARQLHNHAKERKWRTDEGKRLSLAVTEVKEQAA